jgi:hypothetical protein
MNPATSKIAWGTTWAASAAEQWRTRSTQVWVSVTKVGGPALMAIHVVRNRSGRRLLFGAAP